jgi:hypothetical protein
MLIAAFTLAQILGYPFPSALVRDARGTAIAYAIDQRGVRSIWFAAAPDFSPRQLFSSNGDDGQELTDLVISNDDKHVVYVRGGDHDANWPLPLQPGPASLPAQPEMQVWSIRTTSSTPKLLGSGDAPAISRNGARVAFTSGGAVMIAPIDGSSAAKRLFFDRGQDSDLRWSPDGSALAFVSTRTDHSFIGIYRNDATPLQFLSPTTSQDIMRAGHPTACGSRSFAFPVTADHPGTRSIGIPCRGKFGLATCPRATRRQSGPARIRRAARYRRLAWARTWNGSREIAWSSTANKTTGRICIPFLQAAEAQSY